jgi:Arc/MetJ-type ribon-helix-helix transcriptional regulator
MARITITVDDALMAWIEQRVEAGGYADVSAYLCHLIRQDLQANGVALPVSDQDGVSEQPGASPPNLA